MANFYDEMFPEPPKFEGVVFDYIDRAHLKWAPFHIPQVLMMEFGFTLEEANEWINTWRILRK